MCMACTALFIHALGNVSHNHTADKKRRNKCNQINLNKEMFFFASRSSKSAHRDTWKRKKDKCKQFFFLRIVETGKKLKHDNG